MSLELRMVTEGDCECGQVWPRGHKYTKCRHPVVCDLGEIEYTDPRPAKGEVGHLMLMSVRFADQLQSQGPRVRWRDGYHEIHSVTRDEDGQAYAHLEFEGFRWTWKLITAHWWDRGDPDMLVGVWPD